MNTEITQQETVESTTYQGREVRLCSDGKYRWMYELSLLRNPTMFLTVSKVMALSAGIVWLIMLIATAFQGDLDWEQFLFLLKLIGIVLGIMIALTVISLLVLAALYHGKYIAVFEMDENQVTHIQVPRQFKKAQVIGVLTALIGLASKNPTVAGAGLLSASRNTMTSTYDRVRRVKGFRKRNLIKVNQRLFKNQVYVRDEDFVFVYDFIKSHCPNAK